MTRKKSMHAQAVECANDLGANSWWYHPDLVEAFKAGWRASTKARWPKAKVTKRRPSKQHLHGGSFPEGK